MLILVILSWISPLLLAENLSKLKPANQTGTFGGMVASRAVDGRYGTPLSQDNCAHPNNQEIGDDGVRLNAEWWVDLGETYLVDNITIYNTYNVYGSRRLEQFVMSVGPTLDVMTDCGVVHTDAIDKGGNITVLCNIRGRYAKFRRVGGFEPHLVTLCEVEVYGGSDEGSTITETTSSPHNPSVVDPEVQVTGSDGLPVRCQESCDSVPLIPWSIVGVLSLIVVIQLIVILVIWKRSRRRVNESPGDKSEVLKGYNTGFDRNATDADDYAGVITSNTPEPPQIRTRGHKHKVKGKDSPKAQKSEQYDYIET